MRRQYLALACLLSIVSGLAVTSKEVINDNSGLATWLLFSIVSGMILNLPVSYPKWPEIIRESIIVSGFYCLTIFGRFFYESILSLLFAGQDTYLYCFKELCREVPIKELLKPLTFWSVFELFLLLLLFVFIASSILIIISTFSGKLLLKYTKQFFKLDPNVFEEWKKIVTGALSFGGFIFMAVKFVG